jgi:hypothetical protein
MSGACRYPGPSYDQALGTKSKTTSVSATAHQLIPIFMPCGAPAGHEVLWVMGCQEIGVALIQWHAIIE